MMKNWLNNRLKEHLTWAGVFLVAGSFGFELTDAQQYGITFLGMALAGADDVKLKRLLKPKKPSM